MSNPIPEKLINFNVYDDTEKLVGVSGEVTLPNFEAVTETISGAGIAGEFESATPGHFGSQTIEITFRTMMDKSFSLMKNRGRSIVFRGAQQIYDTAVGRSVAKKVKVTLRGQPKGLELGKMAVGQPTDTKNTLEILYIKIEVDDRVMLEFDKLNFVFIVDGEDILGQIRNMI
ncbi:phage major tail tube protein [Bacillaceae bacterium IKA-2]|nr:phage major tail tube protein [Bacillaceae bacterium IKA-2]